MARRQMRRSYRFVCWIGCWALLLVRCQPAEREIATRVSAQLDAALAATLDARPTATALSSATPYPTFPPLPTATSYPTATAFRTQTPYATATRYPTHTPFPTIPAAPTATARPPVVAQPAVDYPTAVPDLTVSLLQAMEEARTALQDFGYLIDSALAGNHGISCQAVVDLYDRVMAVPALDVADQSPRVQSAYSTYQAAVAEFDRDASPMALNCRHSIDAQADDQIPESQWSMARWGVNRAVAKLTPAIQSLGGS